MEVASAVFVIAGTLAGFTGAGFCIALNQRMKFHQLHFKCNWLS
jgi:hypothetical protein